jgi:hypothetical protein
MIRDDTRASEAQSDTGPAVSIIVDQELRSPAAGNRLLLKLEAHTALAMRAYPDDVEILRA